MVFINFNTTIDDHTKFQKSPGITRPIGEPVLLPGVRTMSALNATQRYFRFLIINIPLTKYVYNIIWVSL